MFIVKNCWGPVSPVGCAPTSLGQSLAHMQIPYGAEIWSSEKVNLGRSKLTCPTLVLVDQVHRTFFAECERNCCRHITFPILDISIRRYWRSEFEVVWSRH